MKIVVAALAFAGMVLTGSASLAQSAKPTIVLVHGAFADASSWNGVIPILQKDGYVVVAAANPLRSVKGDAENIHALLAATKGPVVLVAHSYGGMVISNATAGAANVEALVYVAGFAPDTGENAFALSGKFPGSLLGPAIVPVPLPSGGADLYIRQDKVADVFAQDVSAEQARLIGATQRPLTDTAGNEASGEPGWKTLPSWFVYGDQDRVIPPQLHAFMAERAKPKETVAVKGASHVVMLSHPEEVARVIEAAATAP